MKRIHNVRVRVHSPSRETVEQVMTFAESAARTKNEEKIAKRITEDEGLVIGEVWLDRQQTIKRFVKQLLEKLGTDDKKRVRENSTKHLDTATHCYLFLETTSFVKGEMKLTSNPNGAVALRLNIACWPANKDNASKTLKEIFS